MDGSVLSPSETSANKACVQSRNNEEIDGNAVALNNTNLDGAPNKDTQSHQHDSFHLRHEAFKLLYISLPSVVVQFSVRCIFAQTASVVGRLLSTQHLAAFSLGSLTANLSCQSIIMGALTAAETYMPRAFGQHRYHTIGHLVVQSLVVCTILLLVPVLVLCTSMKWLFDTLGQNSDVSVLAVEWIRIYVVAIPFVLLFRVLQAFLNAQHVVLPLVFGSTVGAFVIHPLLLKWIVPSLGLWGSGLCIVLTQGVMVLLILLYLWMRPLQHPDTSPVWSRAFIAHSLQPEPLKDFVKLGLGGVLSLSEWWFWETVCFIVGTFGVVPLAAHSIAYNVIPVVFMGAVGLATGLTVRLGNELSTNVLLAKKIAVWCMGFAIFIGLIVFQLLYRFRQVVIRLFTNDDNVVKGCDEIWGRMCTFVFILYVFSINRGILRALGMQWHIAAVVVSCLWCGALPLILYKAVYLKQGLDAIWTILPMAYAIMQVLLVVSYTRSDWMLVGDDIHSETTVAASKEVEMESVNLIT